MNYILRQSPAVAAALLMIEMKGTVSFLPGKIYKLAWLII
jgi:hypothetical protein